MVNFTKQNFITNSNQQEDEIKKNTKTKNDPTIFLVPNQQTQNRQTAANSQNSTGANNSNLIPKKINFSTIGNSNNSNSLGGGPTIIPATEQIAKPAPLNSNIGNLPVNKTPLEDESDDQTFVKEVKGPLGLAKMNKSAQQKKNIKEPNPIALKAFDQLSDQDLSNSKSSQSQIQIQPMSDDDFKKEKKKLNEIFQLHPKTARNSIQSILSRKDFSREQKFDLIKGIMISDRFNDKENAFLRNDVASMPELQRFIAGFGLGLKDLLYNGFFQNLNHIGNFFGLVSDEEVKNFDNKIAKENKVAEALVNTNEGGAGRISGNFVGSLPLTVIPGGTAATALRGATVAGMLPVRDPNNFIQGKGLQLAGGAVAGTGAPKMAEKVGIHDALSGLKKFLKLDKI